MLNNDNNNNSVYKNFKINNFIFTSLPRRMERERNDWELNGLKIINFSLT